MKKQKNFKLIREFINLILNFFKPFGLPDDLLKIPTNVKKMGFRVSFIELSTTVISLIFCFPAQAYQHHD